MRLPIIDSNRVDAYLARLGISEVSQDPTGLAALQAAHLMAVPFHNLLLLANDGRPWGLQPLPEVVDDAIAGVGGNCDRTTPPFAALLQAVGFDAKLAAATVREPGDHFVCLVQTGRGRFLSDVGNGHPYLRPWNLDGTVQEQYFHSWRFRFDPRASAGPTLLRVLPDGTFKTIYVVDSTPRAYDDFAPIVMSHYTQADFGPFLSGLRAVCIRPETMLTLRDTEYARDTRFGRSVRRVVGRDAVRALLTELFGLPAQLIENALDVIGRRRPDLFGEPRWFALGRGHVSESTEIDAPARDEVPDIIVSLATVGRSESMRRLIDTLVEEVQASRYPGRVGVLVVENHEETTSVHNDPPGIMVHRVPISELRPALARAAEAGVLPKLGDCLPVPIGAAREAQIVALRAHLASPVPNLPHPEEHPVVVWMVDDDIAFQQLGADGRIGRHTHLLYRVARYWSALPQHAVVLGTFTGDPPVPGLDSLGGQLHDLAGNIEQMIALGPYAAWKPPPSPPHRFDAYYDLTEAVAPHTDAIWPYARHRAGDTVGEVALDLLHNLTRLLDGQQLTRPLVWDGTDVTPRSSLRRGGNTLFLDFDALFRWPTPVLASADGVTTRRADTVWAALAQVEQPGAVVETTLPLLHGREGQGEQLSQNSVANAGRHTAAQVRGLVIARAIAEGRPVACELPARENRVSAQRNKLRALLGYLRYRIGHMGAWSDPKIDDAMHTGMEVLAVLDRLTEASEPLPGDPAELDAFVARLPAAVRAWRGAW